jgi:hypothetical protein
LLHTARERLHAGQQALELEVPAPVAGSVGQPVVEATGSLVLWDALVGLYDALGFAVIRDERFGRWYWADHRADQQGRHGPGADRGRRGGPVTGHIPALSAADRSLSRFQCKPRVTNMVNLSQGKSAREEDDEGVERGFPTPRSCA